MGTPRDPCRGSLDGPRTTGQARRLLSNTPYLSCRRREKNRYLLQVTVGKFRVLLQSRMAASGGHSVRGAVPVECVRLSRMATFRYCFLF